MHMSHEGSPQFVDRPGGAAADGVLIDLSCPDFTAPLPKHMTWRHLCSLGTCAGLSATLLIALQSQSFMLERAIPTHAARGFSSGS